MKTPSRATVRSVAAAILSSACGWLPLPGVASVRASYAVEGAGYGVLASAQDESQLPTLAGHWIADVVMADGDTVELVVDLGQRGERWIGEFDAADYGIEDYPVGVARADTVVTLHFGGPEADFNGTFSADGLALAGIITFGDQRIPTRFARTGEAHFSEMLLALESAADDSSLVIRLADDGAELRARFNADHGKTRLLMLLSPT